MFHFVDLVSLIMGHLDVSRTIKKSFDYTSNAFKLLVSYAKARKSEKWTNGVTQIVL